jgi:co-chaperonin GroES (HSP10)
MVLNYHPVRDNLKVSKFEKEQQMGSFILVQTAPKNNITVGIVEEVGDGYINPHGVNVTSKYKVGDLVVFKLHNQVDEVLENGVTKYILTSAEVIAKAEQVGE